MLSVVPVSYTHLDVYKRQEQDRPKEPPTYEDVLKENRVLKEENERNAHPSKQYQHKPHRKGNGGYPGMHKTTYNDADMKKEI